MALLKLVNVQKGRTTNAVDGRITPTPGRVSIGIHILTALGIDPNDKKPSIRLFFNEEATGLEDSWYISKGFGEVAECTALAPNADENGRIASYGFNSADFWNRTIQYFKTPTDTVILTPMNRLEMANAGLTIDDRSGNSYSAACTAIFSVKRAVQEVDGIEEDFSTEDEDGNEIPVYKLCNFIFDEHKPRVRKEKKAADSAEGNDGGDATAVDTIVEDENDLETV